jgi:hypothetical protein
METEYVYVLKLEEGKFYVGKSKDVDARLRGVPGREAVVQADGT